MDLPEGLGDKKAGKLADDIEQKIQDADMELVVGGYGEIPLFSELGVIWQLQFEGTKFSGYIKPFPKDSRNNPEELLYVDSRHICGDPRKFQEGLIVTFQRDWSPEGPIAIYVRLWP